MTQPKGYLFVDHRASPGLDEESAIKLGYHPDQVKEGQVFEADTLRCNHCGTQFIMNPLRTRPREHCFKCNQYICDGCAGAARQPDYVHRCLDQQIDDYTRAFANINNFNNWKNNQHG